MELVFFDELSEAVRLSKRQLRRLWTQGDMPEPFRISPRRLAWRRQDIDAWLASRAPAAPVAEKERVL